MYIMDPEKLGSTSHLDGLDMTGFCGQGLELRKVPSRGNHAVPIQEEEKEEPEVEKKTCGSL